MTENKRFTMSQNGTLHTVRDNLENKPLGVFEFKDNEFPAYACFHMIIDLMNDLSDENKKLKSENEELKKVLGAILFEIKRDINVFNTKQAGEIKVFVHPNNFDLISEVLRKYGA